MAENESSTPETREVNSEDNDEKDLNSERNEESIQKPNKNEKVRIHLRPASNAPIMKKQNWDVEPDRTIGKIMLFVKKYLKMQPSESLFLYVNQAFAPTPDQQIRNLYDCYEMDGKLTLYYYLGQAWG